MELVRKFQVDVNIVELSLTGQMAAIGFSDQLRITQIFMDDLNVSLLFLSPAFTIIVFSIFNITLDCQDVQLSALQRGAVFQFWSHDGCRL